MERRIFNPWTFAEKFGVSHAYELVNPKSWLLCAGQASVDDDGNLVAPGDMAGQIRQALDNVQRLLVASDYTTDDIVRMTIYVTDVDAFIANLDVMVGRLREWNVAPPGVLCGCARLGVPGWMIEIEVTAAR